MKNEEKRKSLEDINGYYIKYLESLAKNLENAIDCKDKEVISRITNDSHNIYKLIEMNFRSIYELSKFR